MNTDRWNRVKELFNEACEVSPDARRTYVKKACRGDAELEAEVMELLRADGESSTLLDLVSENPSDFLGHSVEKVPGDPDKLIGPYRLIRELGRGGMGIVYLAERADGQFRKKLALKLVKRGMDTDEILHRFRHERQILANLEHPNIARLYDGGASDDGRPYLVMEYIEGKPITEYCDRLRLPVSERLRLFLTVCEGVQFAHQNLIVHRDLKPSNIMVTGDGSVRLLDFGVAKLLEEQRQSDEVTPHTRPWLRMVTPDYAAPEQFTGSRITTATDVYALGILLYELLTGSHPYKDSQGRNTFGIPDISRWVESPVARIRKTSDTAVFNNRNSTRNALLRRLKNDLGNIVMTALNPDPQHRYRSAEQLHSDISRYLNGHPVMARRQTTLYRFKKFTGRNKTAVASVSLLILFSVLFGVFSWMQHLQTARERDIAASERDKALMLAGFMERLFDASNPYNPEPERIDTLRAFELLQRGAVTAETELEERPAIQAQMYRSVGNAYRGMGRIEEAETYLTKALDLRRSEPFLDPDDLLESYVDLGFLLYVKGEYNESELLLREAMTLAESHPETGDIQLANVMHTLAVTLSARTKWVEAEPLFRRALEIRTGVFGDIHQEVAATKSALASLLVDLEEQDEAHTLLRESVRARREIYGDHHPSVAVGLNNLAVQLRSARQFDEAEQAVREALQINRAALGDHHLYVAQNLELLGSILRFNGDFEAAEVKLHESIALYRHHHGGDHPGLSVTLFAYAGLLMALDRLDEAEAALHESLQIDLKADQVSYYAVAVRLYRLGTVQFRQGAAEQALESVTESVALLEEIIPETHPRLVYAKNRMALITGEMGDVDSAKSILLEVYASLQGEHDPGHPLVQRTLGKLVALYQASGEEGEMAYYEALLE